MRVALLQGPTADDVDGALVEVADAARRAAAAGAAILVCSELTCTGYRRPLRPEPDPRTSAPGPIGRAIAATARKSGIAVVYGYVESGPVGGVYNAAAVFAGDGSLLAHYRKTHLYRPRDGAPDDAHFTAGDVPVVQFRLGDLTCGLLICYDVEFPEAVRAHALAGTDCLLVPTALAHPDTHVATLLVPARAVESQLFIAYANRVGTERAPGGTVVVYCGLSCAVAPDGTDLARAGSTSAQLLVVDLDPDGLAASRRRNTYLVDRRPDLYHPDLYHPDLYCRSDPGAADGRAR